MGGLDDLDENDPKAVARWAREMKDEMGEDLGPEFDDMVVAHRGRRGSRVGDG